MTPEARYPAALLTVLLLWTAALGIAPHFRQDWLLENVLVLVSVPLLVITYKQLRFSNAAYTCLFAFFMLHELGAHYTYSLVPYDAWGRALLGVSDRRDSSDSTATCSTARCTSSTACSSPRRWWNSSR